MDNGDSFISSITIVKKKKKKKIVLLICPLGKEKKMLFVTNQMLLSWEFLAF